VELKSLIFSFTIVFSLEMVHKPNIFMYKSTLKMTDLQGRILSSWLFSFTRYKMSYILLIERNDVAPHARIF
jgi:hypothetical protein